MGIKSDVSIIYNNRFLRTEKEVYDFETALGRVISNGDVSAIPLLCECFHDDTETYDVMFSLIQAIESLYKDHVSEGIFLIAKSVSSVIDVAPDWMEIIHYRILNDVQTRKAYRSSLLRLSTHERSVAIRLLKSIKNEDPELFGDSVDSVISE